MYRKYTEFMFDYDLFFINKTIVKTMHSSDIYASLMLTHIIHILSRKYKNMYSIKNHFSISKTKFTTIYSSDMYASLMASI